MNVAITVLIVDDEPAARASIRALLADEPGVVIARECGNGLDAVRAIHELAPDLVFLDIQMPGMDGIAVLRQLQPGEIPVVVFVTAYDQYALRAFEVRALDYLLKPFDDARFRETLERARTHVRQRRIGELSQQLLSLLEPAADFAPAAQARTRIALKHDGRVSLLPVAEVDWIEAAGDCVTLHAGKDRHLLRETMKQLETQLDPATFVRIHRSTIVNINRIKELQPWFRGEFVVLLTDGTRLKLSRGCKGKLEQVLGRPL